jgi:S1-C subfamily serine protease
MNLFDDDGLPQRERLFKDKALQDTLKVDVEFPRRRNIIKSSAVAILSALLAATTSGSDQANAGSLAVLEESENRRIEIFERNAPSVVFIDTFAEKQDVFSTNVVEVPLGTGSGFVWDKQGHIVTNYHVVRNAKFAQVALITPRKGEKASMGFFPSQQQLPQQASTSTLSSSSSDAENSSMDIFSVSPSASRSTTNKFTSADYKRTVFKAKVIGSDPGKDIAVLKIDAPEELLYPISVGKSAGLKVGQLSLAIGNPFGLDHSLTAGVISGLGREVRSPIGRPITNVIQVSAEKGETFLCEFNYVFASASNPIS